MAKPVDDDENDSFDLDKFRKLLQLMEKFDVSEVNLQNDQESWKIRRGPRPPAYGMPQFAAPAYAPAAMPQAVAVPVAAPVAAAPAPAPAGVTINAPTVGTFYSAASPDDAPFATVGTIVKTDTVVCMIEAMKVFNQILAEKAGRIVEVLVENGDAIGFGQPLFRIEPI